MDSNISSSYRHRIAVVSLISVLVLQPGHFALSVRSGLQVIWVSGSHMRATCLVDLVQKLTVAQVFKKFSDFCWSQGLLLFDRALGPVLSLILSCFLPLIISEVSCMHVLFISHLWHVSNMSAPINLLYWTAPILPSCIRIHPPLSSSFLGPNTVLSILSLCSFLSMRDEVSHSYKL